MAPHSSTLAWKIPWTEEPGRLQSMVVSLNWRLSDFTFTFHFHTLEKEMATYSSVLAWRIPGKVEPGGLSSLGSHRVGHDWSDLAAAAAALGGGGFLCGSAVKKQPATQEPQEVRVQSLGEEDPWRREWQPTQFYCLENPTDRGARRATDHRVAKSQTQLKRLSTHT